MASVVSRSIAIFMAVGLSVFAACAGEGSYSVQLVFPGAQAEQSTGEISILAADPGGAYQCEGEQPAPWVEDDLSVFAKVVSKYPPTAPIRLPKVPRGAIMFLAEGRTGEGATILRGCVVADVQPGETLAVEIVFRWVCIPDPAGEIPNNGEDDDCDGLTDECVADNDCDDGEPCTIDRCRQEDGRCVNQWTPNPGQEGLDIAGSCADGVDNDCDRAVDEDDTDCRQCQTDADCQDDNPCTTKTCGPDNHCLTDNVTDGQACDDGLYCTEATICQGGVCTGQTIDCSFMDDDCNLGACDEDINRCDKQPRADGINCDDTDACTHSDACYEGICTGTEYSCDDGKTCTDDICLGNGACTHDNLTGTCDDSDPCTFPDMCAGGDCHGTPYSCDDGTVCTNDVCDGDGTCTNPPVSGECDDGDPATWGDHCVAGACVGNSCDCPDDGNECTDEVCDTDGNCTHPDNQLPCNDADPCSMDDTCDQGVCSGIPTDLDGDSYLPEACGGQDCDDTDPDVNPDGTEICDSLDNDCDGNTDDTCPASCVGRIRPGTASAYMFCSNGMAWQSARSACEGAGFRLVRMDSGSENGWVADTCETLGYGDTWIGGNDLDDHNTWRWTDGEIFWNGDFTGSAAPGMYENWAWPSAPLDDGNHCVEMYIGDIGIGDMWNDTGCSATNEFVCKLY